MRNREILQSEESATAPTRCQTNPSNRILVIDDDVDIRQSSAEVPIRHETNLWVKNTSINRQQNQAEKAASECRL